MVLVLVKSPLSFNSRLKFTSAIIIQSQSIILILGSDSPILHSKFVMVQCKEVIKLTHEVPEDSLQSYSNGVYFGFMPREASLIKWG